MTITCIWHGRNILGEGPLWDTDAQMLYWVDIINKIIHCWHPKTQQHQQWQLPDKPSAMALCADKRLLVALPQQFAFFEPVSGKITSWIKPKLSANEVFNDGKCDRRGRFWIGTKDDAEKAPIGGLYRLDPDGTFTKMDHGFIVSNGLGWSPDNRYMYFTDGDLHRQILRYNFNLATGTITNRQTFVKILEELGYPDGLTVDSAGYVWSAHWDGWRITRYAPNGKVDRIIPVPVQKPTSCCFGGEDLKTLFITSATRDLSAEELKKQPEAGNILAIDADVSGITELRYDCHPAT